MDIEVSIDVMGTDVEFDWTVDDDDVHCYATNDDCNVWANEHFLDHGDVEATVVEWLEALPAPKLHKLLAPLLGVEE